MLLLSHIYDTCITKLWKANDLWPGWSTTSAPASAQFNSEGRAQRESFALRHLCAYWVSMRQTRWGILVLSLFSVAVADGSSQTTSSNVPEANPGRPTVSTPATLTPVGYLQFEDGLLYADESPEFSTRLGIGQVIKLTVHPRLEVLLQAEPFVHSLIAKQKDVQEGEVFAGFQAVLLSGGRSRPTIAVSYFRRVHPGPAPELDIGTSAQNALLLVSGDVWGFHYDANGIIAEQTEGRLRRAQFGQTLSISHPLKKFTISSEVWHFSQPLIRGSAIGTLWAVAYPVRGNLVIDAGFDHGLTRTSTQWEGFAGFTYLLPRRLWGRKKKNG